MKSLQWLQKVGCLKNRATNLWFLTSRTSLRRRAPRRSWRANPIEDLVDVPVTSSPSHTDPPPQTNSRHLDVATNASPILLLPLLPTPIPLPQSEFDLVLLIVWQWQWYRPDNVCLSVCLSVRLHFRYPCARKCLASRDHAQTTSAMTSRRLSNTTSSLI